MEASSLQKRIAEHHEALAILSRRVDQVLVGVEALTLEAHESLAEYQEKKRQAGRALSAASRKFLLAQRAFGKADDLFADVTAVENIHIALSHSVNDLMARNNSAEVRRILREFMKIRRAFRATYRQIERCRKEARMAEKVNKNGPND
jgi:hypothetical protein